MAHTHSGTPPWRGLEPRFLWLRAQRALWLSYHTIPAIKLLVVRSVTATRTHSAHSLHSVKSDNSTTGVVKSERHIGYEGRLSEQIHLTIMFVLWVRGEPDTSRGNLTYASAGLRWGVAHASTSLAHQEWPWFNGKTWVKTVGGQSPWGGGLHLQGKWRRHSFCTPGLSAAGTGTDQHGETRKGPQRRIHPNRVFSLYQSLQRKPGEWSLSTIIQTCEWVGVGV